MNPRYNIIKFSDSYRNSKHRHTILLPLLMVVVVLVTFTVVALTNPLRKGTTRTSIYSYKGAKNKIQSTFASKQSDETKADSVTLSSERVRISSPPQIDLEFISPNAPSLKDMDEEMIAASEPAAIESLPAAVSELIIPSARVIEPGESGAEATPVAEKETIAAGGAIIPSDPSSSTISSVAAESLNLNRFTPWMTKGEMNDLIVRLNEGHRKSFWQRGHWITAVEGLWNGTEPEYRIIYEKSPQNQQIFWRYRIDKPKEEFNAIIVDMNREGYDLVQSQFFEMPDGTRRYQGVWQKGS